MDYKKVILLVLLFAFPLGQAGAGGYIEPPMDDAYYWPGFEFDHAPFPPKDSEMVQQADTVASSQAQPMPAVTFTNVQDTTVTVVIKR